MRSKSKRRLRVAVLFIVAALVGSIAASAVALANGWGNDPSPPSEWDDAGLCFKLFEEVMGGGGTPSGDGIHEYLTETVSIGGQSVTVTLRWETATKVFTVCVESGFKITYLYVKGGTDGHEAYNSAGGTQCVGPLHVGHGSPTGQVAGS